MIECSFGILSNDWRILTRAIDLQPDRTIAVVKACCVLHNFVRIKDGFQFDLILYDSLMDGLQPTGIKRTRVQGFRKTKLFYITTRLYSMEI